MVSLPQACRSRRRWIRKSLKTPNSNSCIRSTTNNEKTSKLKSANVVWNAFWKFVRYRMKGNSKLANILLLEQVILSWGDHWLHCNRYEILVYRWYPLQEKPWCGNDDCSPGFLLSDCCPVKYPMLITQSFLSNTVDMDISPCCGCQP